MNAERLKELLATMNIPQMRRDISSEANLRWLVRNIAIKNGGNPNIKEALVLIERLINK
jgi:hypothetical protein